MDALKSFLTPFGSGTNALQDTMKLVVLGGTVETARRMSVSAWTGFVDSFFLTAHFAQGDFPFDWIMNWLAKQPAWARSREFEITTRSIGRGNSKTAGDLEDEEEEEDLVVSGKKKRRVSFMPSIDTTHTVYYHGHWLRITRTKRFPDDIHGASIKISVVARNNDILKKLVLEAKRDYEKDAVHRVHIYLADTTYNCWRWNGARHKRPMSSIVLQPGVKDMIINDCKDFLASEAWYADRGIPFRRGYLLHGVPGSGKTSLIHSLAGELGLDIYVLSLSAKGMSDNTLTTLMGLVPTRCIVLLEDLDAAFTRSVSRDSNSTGAPTAPTEKESNENKDKKDDGSTLSLSGLLNSLDGVAAAEGRLLFATTNHIERLDPALSRPGRMDVWVNFTYATKFQAEGIFKCFFPHKPTISEEEEAESTESTESESESAPQEPKDPSQQNLPLPKRKPITNQLMFSEEEIAELAKRFADAIPENELSVASLQGYLLKNKTRPRECVDEVEEWVKQERETREKIKLEKEKAEREAKEKEKKAAEEKEKKEKEAKEKEGKEKKKERAKSKKTSRSDSTAKVDEAASKGTNTTETTKDSTPSSSSSESDNSTGTDGDTEESVTSEDEVDNNAKKSDKWVSVKGQAANAATPASAEESEPTTEDSK
ncbi:P-loop containing nucleoside triphosphate hydrolase protein [Amanita rubescens]|nr:P-loop containing nucleoside triphosphate hydrolase protein [Amanita rubescens]